MQESAVIVLESEAPNTGREAQRREKQRQAAESNKAQRKTLPRGGKTADRAEADAATTAKVPKKRKKKTPKPQPPVPRQAYTIDEFCQAYRLSRSTYYNLKLQKRAPAEIEPIRGGKKIITAEAAAAWCKKFTQDA